jgi:hypothetical protein
VSDVVANRAPARLPTWFLLALPLLAIVFAGLWLRRANRSTLRGDEILTLHSNWRGQSIGDLLSKGAVPQVSTAPLLYVIDSLADRSRAPLRYLGLTPPGYCRLPSVLFTAGLGLGAAFVVARRIRRQPDGGAPIQYLLVLCGLASFYCHPKVFAFAGVERPYGLWNGLWLFLLAWLLGRPPLPRVPLALLSLLAATATAACFQILAVGIALVVVRAAESKSPKEILKEGGLLLALPALVGAYYALRSSDLSFEERLYSERAPQFLRFWLLSNLHVWIAAGAMSFLALKRPALREFAIPPVALMALIVVMPLIFTLSHMRGYSMVSRQYIWTSTAVPLALLFVALSWSELRPTRYLQAVTVVTALGIPVGYAVATYYRPPLRNDSREMAMLERESPLMKTLQSRRPTCLLFPNALGEIERANLELIGEWIRIRYRDLPDNGKSIWIRDVKGRLEAADREPPGEESWIAIRLDR